MRIDELNALDAVSAARELRRCCGSARWADLMAAARPFASAGALASAGDRIWRSLDRRDWLEAFAAHPRIGQPTRSSWEAAEQAGMKVEQAGVKVGQAGVKVNDDTRSALERLNREYEARFGHIFIVCATGKTAAEILAILDERLRNNPDEELRVAAAEQQQITRLRLGKLLT